MVINAIVYGLSSYATGYENTTALRAALTASVDLGVPTVIIPDGVYLLETDIYNGRTVDIWHNQILQLSPGAKIVATLPSGATSHSHPVFFMRGENSRITGGTITGTMAANHYGIIVNEGTTDNSIDNLSIRQFGGDAIVSYGNGFFARRVMAEKIGRNGITIGGGNNVKIKHCFLYDIGELAEPGAAIICEPGPDHTVSNVVVDSNYIVSAKVGAYIQSGQSITSNVKILKNTICQSGIWAINIHRVNGGRAKGNDILGENQRVTVINSKFDLIQKWENFVNA